MKYLAALALLISLPALAQTPTDPAFVAQAVGGELTEMINKEVQWRTAALEAQAQVQQLQAQIKDLQAKLDAATKPAEPATPPAP